MRKQSTKNALKLQNNVIQIRLDAQVQEILWPEFSKQSLLILCFLRSLRMKISLQEKRRIMILHTVLYCNDFRGKNDDLMC